MWDNFSFEKGTFDTREKDVIHQPYSPEEFKQKRASGKYRKKNARNGRILEEGEFSYGERMGQWVQYDEDGDKKIYRVRMERCGAICADGSYSSATGRGACSRHGGVAQWLYEERKVFVQGTGKFDPIENRVRKLQNSALKLYKLSNYYSKESEQILLKELIRFKTEQNNRNAHQHELQQQLQRCKEKLQKKNHEIQLLKQKLVKTEQQLYQAKERLQIRKIQHQPKKQLFLRLEQEDIKRLESLETYKEKKQQKPPKPHSRQSIEVNPEKISEPLSKALPPSEEQQDSPALTKIERQLIQRYIISYISTQDSL